MKNGIRVALVFVILVSLALCFDALAPFAQADEPLKLTPAAAKAIEVHFPAATVESVSQETEDGVLYYEVALKDGEKTIEVEVTPNGDLGEVETGVTWDDVPEVVRQTILTETRGAMPQGVERHEVWGVPRGKSFERVTPPIVLYEIEVETDGAWREISFTTTGLVLTEVEEAEPDAEQQGADDDDSDESGKERAAGT